MFILFCTMVIIGVCYMGFWYMRLQWRGATNTRDISQKRLNHMTTAVNIVDALLRRHDLGRCSCRSHPYLICCGNKCHGSKKIGHSNEIPDLRSTGMYK